MFSIQVPGIQFIEPVESWAELFFTARGRESHEWQEPVGAELLPLHEACDLHGISYPEGSSLLLSRIAEIHERYAEWSTRYSDRALNYGVWILFGEPCWYRWIFQSETLPLSAHERMFRSLLFPFRDYVGRLPEGEPMGEGFFMLWHMLLAHWTPPSGLVDVILDVLREMLALPDRRCQGAALHGLNHLNDPRRPAIVQRYIDRTRFEWDPHWLAGVRDGDAM